MKSRYFIAIDEGYVYRFSVFKKRIENGETDEFLLEEEKRDIGGPMYCQLNDCFPEKGDCGKLDCEDYNPCNGKSGRCRHLKNGFVETGKRFKLTKNGLTEV
jgi:hypothetical protein